MGCRPRVVIWTAHARDGLNDVLEYIARDSFDAALRTLERFLSAAESLSTLSLRSRVVPELSNPSVRETFVGKYRLLYEVSDQEIHILAVLHSARDFARWRAQQEQGN